MNISISNQQLYHFWILLASKNALLATVPSFDSVPINTDIDCAK